MKRGAAASGLLHAVILLALLVSLPRAAPDDQPPSPDVEFEIVSDQPRQVTKAAEQSPTPAAAVAPKATLAPPPPRSVARASPPPAPSPPIPPTPIRPAPATPPPVPSPPMPRPPIQPPDEAAPPTPPKPPSPPLKAVPAPPLPTPPRRAPPIPSPPAPASQPSAAKDAPPSANLVENTLDRLRAAERQAQSAAGKASPVQGGAPKVGGSPTGDITARLTGEQRGAIGDKVRECWTKDEGALELAKMSVAMTVTIDAAGLVRVAEVADSDKGKLADPRFRAFAERARRANLDSRCANLSNELPKSELGHVARLTFRFRP